MIRGRRLPTGLRHPQSFEQLLPTGPLGQLAELHHRTGPAGTIRLDAARPVTTWHLLYLGQSGPQRRALQHTRRHDTLRRADSAADADPCPSGANRDAHAARSDGDTGPTWPDGNSCSTGANRDSWPGCHQGAGRQTQEARLASAEETVDVVYIPLSAQDAGPGCNSAEALTRPVRMRSWPRCLSAAARRHLASPG